jgi:hypothetical protein
LVCEGKMHGENIKGKEIKGCVCVLSDWRESILCWL